MVPTALLVLGMHRSGTSCFAGSLQQHGLFLGEVFESNPYNKKGNRENEGIMQLNNEVLKYNNASWDRPPVLLTWSQEHRRVRDKIIHEFNISGHSLFGFKDPRTLVTLEFWLEGFATDQLKFVGSFRHPLAAASSLVNRDGMDLKKALNLWVIYNTQLLKLQQEKSFPLISYDVDEVEYKTNLARIVADLGLSFAIEDEPFFDGALRHENADEFESLDEEIKSVYTQLVQIYQAQQK